MACVLRLLDLGIPAQRIELWHQELDGREGSTARAGAFGDANGPI